MKIHHGTEHEGAFSWMACAMATNSPLRCKPSSSSKAGAKIKNMKRFQNVVAFLKIVCSEGCCKCNKMLVEAIYILKILQLLGSKRQVRWLEEIPSWACHLAQSSIL